MDEALERIGRDDRGALPGAVTGHAVAYGELTDHGAGAPTSSRS